jgi:hypothetical protein
MQPNRLELENVGQIKHSDIAFGDLTVLVGPQATGKSIFLQLLKLVIDRSAIQKELERFSIDWGGDSARFFDLYFGEGMSGLWGTQSALRVDGVSTDLPMLTRKPRGRKPLSEEKLFFIPAQRVMSLRDGLTRPFTDYRSGDPFALREFSEKLHQLVQKEFSSDPTLFPKGNRLKSALRNQIDKNIFGGFGLKTDVEKSQKRIVLSSPSGGGSLPYLVWSAGQREFVPLLLGLYWLIPPSKVSTRGSLEWVVIEELEMGLHPNAISTTMALVLELISRGYRVCLSTHSPHVLDVVWALQFLKKNGGEIADILEMFDLASNPGTKEIAQAALKKDYKVHFFARDGKVRDISGLDPGSEDSLEAGWGGLSEFSGRVSSIVSRVAARQDKDASE